MKSAALLRLAFVNIAASCTLLVCLEVTAQLAFWLLEGHAVFRPSPGIAALQELFELHPYLVVRPRKEVSVTIGGQGRFTTTRHHTRVTGAPAVQDGTTRVALVGGSTTFGTHVSDEDSWAAQLQTQLGPRFSVLNFGVPGYSTAESIIQMALVIGEFQPDVVVFYQGWNDIRNYHEADLGPDYFGHGIRQFSAMGIPMPYASLFDRLSDVSATAWFARAAARRLQPEPVPAAGREEPDPEVDRLYRRNLATLKLLGLEMGANLVFVPQVLNVDEYARAPGTAAWSRHVANRAMPHLIRRFNAIAADTCAPLEERCQFVAEALTVRWEAEDFADLGHLSPSGGAKLAALLAARIADVGAVGGAESALASGGGQ